MLPNAEFTGEPLTGHLVERKVGQHWLLCLVNALEIDAVAKKL